MGARNCAEGRGTHRSDAGLIALRLGCHAWMAPRQDLSDVSAALWSVSARHAAGCFVISIGWRRATAADFQFFRQLHVIGLVCGLLLLPVALGSRVCLPWHVTPRSRGNLSFRERCFPRPKFRCVGGVVWGRTQTVPCDLRSRQRCDIRSRKRRIATDSRSAAPGERRGQENTSNEFRNHHDSHSYCDPERHSDVFNSRTKV
jgi:hypothetical protein